MRRIVGRRSPHPLKGEEVLEPGSKIRIENRCVAHLYCCYIIRHLRLIIFIMEFIYFKGPREEMFDLYDEKNYCSICGKYGECFSLQYAITTLYNDDEKEEKKGCYQCLREGKFEFWHDTEFGVLDENGFSKVYNHNADNPPTLSESTLAEMRRTPQIITWQQELWLCHCNDFMMYKGIWEPLDFYKNSSTGDGRDLFMEMTNKESNHLWDDSLQDGMKILEEWYPTYYVFECRHCGKLRGNWDCA